jgi:magnesium-transporting ATPase (P-type)
VKILHEGDEGDFQINETSLTGESGPVTKHIDVINKEKSGFDELNFATIGHIWAPPSSRGMR